MSMLRGDGGPRYRARESEGAPYESIQVDKLTPVIGAELSGVDLSRPLSNRQFDEVHRALAENLVIFFRDQHMTDEAAPGFRPALRGVAHPSRRTQRPGSSGADGHPRG